MTAFDIIQNIIEEFCNTKQNNVPKCQKFWINVLRILQGLRSDESGSDNKPLRANDKTEGEEEDIGTTEEHKDEIFH